MLTKTIIWNPFSELHPRDGAYCLTAADHLKQSHQFAIFYENYDGESPPGFYWDIDKEENEIPIDFKVSFWAYVDFLPY